MYASVFVMLLVVLCCTAMLACVMVYCTVSAWLYVADLIICCTCR